MPSLTGWMISLNFTYIHVLEAPTGSGLRQDTAKFLPRNQLTGFAGGVHGAGTREVVPQGTADAPVVTGVRLSRREPEGRKRNRTRQG